MLKCCFKSKFKESVTESINRNACDIYNMQKELEQVKEKLENLSVITKTNDYEKVLMPAKNFFSYEESEESRKKYDEKVEELKKLNYHCEYKNEKKRYELWVKHE